MGGIGYMREGQLEGALLHMWWLKDEERSGGVFWIFTWCALINLTGK